jgi:TonB family protein
MGRIWYPLLVLVGATHVVSAQKPVVSTPSLRADPNFACSAEPTSTPIPELWSPYPGELRAQLIIGKDGRVTDATSVMSTYAPDQTQAALKVLKTWEFVPATKNGSVASLKMNTTIRFSKKSATLEFGFLWPKGGRGCLRWPMPSM